MKPRKVTHKITVIEPDGSITSRYVHKENKLAVLQGAVGGYIELLGYFTTFGGRRCTAYANEEGLIIGLPFNPFGTKLWRDQVKFDPNSIGIVGPVAILQKFSPEESAVQNA